MCALHVVVHGPQTPRFLVLVVLFGCDRPAPHPDMNARFSPEYFQKR